MKKLIIGLTILAFFTLAIQAQKVNNYTYKLDNGIVVKMEKDWGNVWVQQAQAAFKTDDDKHSVDVVMRSMGDLLASGSITTKLMAAGKEVKMTDTPAGTYDLKVSAKLSGKPGTISFEVNGVEVKSKLKTTVTVTIYDYQITIDEVAAPSKGLAGYESKVIKYKGNAETSPKCGIPVFYAKGVRDKAIAQDEKTTDQTGKIKPGIYDVQIGIDVCAQSQKIWLENFTMKPDITYKITANLNAGEITYAGVNRDVKKLHMYPAGTADRLKGVAKPDKASERILFDPATTKFPCPPGSYDVLINIGPDKKYEWKKGIVVRTGTRTDVK
jgi:hypothetical protein